MKASLKKIIWSSILILILFSCKDPLRTAVGETSITTWKDNKKMAISLTYDDGIINQFTVARPIMNELGFPGTFYIITGKIEGAAQGKFMGRSFEEIIAETASIKTDKSNFFERSSAIGFIGDGRAIAYHSNAGSLYEAGSVSEAYAMIDEGYEKLRNQKLKPSNEIIFHDNAIDTTSWKDLKSYAQEGHEIASHTVTHPRLAILDEANLLYELEQSKADIQKFLGAKYTFSAEGPYGTEDERVMEYAHQLYPALRNRMPEPYLEELNRSSNLVPDSSTKEYVQWQRGPLTDTSMETMKSWVDTGISKDNIWLVLVFHGVDGVGWEPKTGEELTEYFNYIKQKESEIWVATFADVTKYIRARKQTSIHSSIQKNTIIVDITSNLDSIIYDVPLTLKTYVPETWESAILTIGSKNEKPNVLRVLKDTKGPYVLYTAPSVKGSMFLKKSIR